MLLPVALSNVHKLPIDQRPSVFLFVVNQPNTVNGVMAHIFREQLHLLKVQFPLKRCRCFMVQLLWGGVFMRQILICLFYSY